jgi:sugar lactone lactonase YvrE
MMLRTVRSLPILIAVAAGTLSAQGMAPVNDPPNPYRTVTDWARMPEGRNWGSTSAVDIDRDGVSIWVAERCGTNSCTGSSLDPIMKFDANGRMVRSFGAGLINFPHGIHVDREGNVWVTDGQDNRPRRGRGGEAPTAPAPATVNGHQIFKFSPDGKLLLTLGKAGGDSTSFFYQPNDVVVAPNGDIIVAEGHASAPGSRARILRFDASGKLLKTWGTFGTGPGEMDQPHALALDSRNRLYVGDRSNNRILIFDLDGKLLDTWYQFSRPSGIYIDANDMIYVADSESGSVGNGRSRTWLRGIRIGSVRDGKVTAFIPDPDQNPPSTSAAEGVAVDSKGNIYGAEVGPRALKRYERKP